MQSRILLIGACLCSISLSACETLDWGRFHKDKKTPEEQAMSVDLAAPPEKDVMMPLNLTDGRPGGMERLSRAPGIAPVPSFPAPRDRDLMVMTDKLSGGAVEIYDIDQAAPINARPAMQRRAMEQRGLPSATDPNVTVFPVDGGSTRAGQWPNALMPRSPAASVMRQSLTPLGSGRKLNSVPGGGRDPARVYFKHGSANLDGDDKRVLSHVAEEAKFAPVHHISVEGHASSRAQTGDAVKDKVLNLKESMNRAFEVSKELIYKGVPAEKIKTVGWGDTGEPDEDQARRVDVITGADR